MTKQDMKFMKMALEEAKKAPFPFGCVLVKDDIVIATGEYFEGTEFDPTSHSEINAIRTACNKLKIRDLKGVKLYTTCEPCPMCFSAIWRANIDELIYGISLEDAEKFFVPEIHIHCDYINKNSGNKIKITGGVLKDEILEYMKEFKEKNI